MKKIFKTKFSSFFAQYQKQVIAFIIILASVFYIFSGVLDGNVISNAHNLYYFEPWVYYKEDDDWKGNLILSDLIDGPTSRYHMAQQLREGEVPVWDFGNKLGNVGVTNLLSSFFYPIRLVSWLIFGVPIGWTLETIIKFTLGGFFMYLLLRKFKVSNLVALIVSIGYMFGGAQLAESQTEYSTVTLTAPIVFYFLERFFQQSTWKNSLWLMLSMVLILTTNFVSVVFFFCFWFSFYSIFRIIFTLNTQEKKQILIKLVVTAISFGLIAAIAIYSTAEFFGNESGINLDYRQSYGLRQSHIFGSLTLIASHFFGHGLLDTTNWKYGTYVNSTIFVGYLTFLAAIVGGTLRVLKRRDFVATIIASLVVLLFFEVYKLSFESLEAITNNLPFFHGNPAMYQKSVLQFMIAILGGLGLDYIVRNDFSKKLKEGILMSILSTIIMAASIWVLQYFFEETLEPSDFYVKYVNQTRIVIILLWVFFNLLIYKNWIFPRVQNLLSDWITRNFSKDREGLKLFVRIILGIFLVCYLYEAKLNAEEWIPYAKASHWYPQTETTDYLHENLDESRVLPIGTGVAVPATLEGYGFPVAAGRMPVPESYERLLQNAYPKAYVDHPTQVVFDSNETNLNAIVWDLVDLKYFVASRNINKERLRENYGEDINIVEMSDSTLIENISRPGHAWLVNDGVVVDTPEQMAKITKTGWNINKDVVFFSNDYLLQEDETINQDFADVQGEVIEYSQDINKMTVKLENEKPVYLIVSSNYFPGWRAKINGIDTDIIPAYGFLKAVKITEAGEHTVEFVFRPDGLLYGGVISSIGIVLVGAAYTYLIRREQKFLNRK